MKRLGVMLVLASATAHADPDVPEPRPAHGSVGAGGALLLTGDRGDRNRYSVELDLEPGGAFGHYGGLVALRGFDDSHDGIVCAGIMREVAAARPRLALDLHADLGLDLDRTRPLAGGGLRATLGIVGPLGLAFDAGGYLVIDGTANTRLELATETLLVGRW